MDLLKDTYEFAVEAHRGQIRKSDPEKPMIIHPINVANMLREYDFDDEVVAAGFLHDVVEDTKYEISDIEEKFGSNVASLVLGATEPDKSLSWEERKTQTIERVKNLDLRHKALICADKISNLEDFRIVSEIKGDYDFSAFNRGFDSQKWYNVEIYNSLILNEDENFPMFVRYKELIDYVFFNNEINNYIKDKIFENNEDEYKELLKTHFRKEEVYKMKQVLPSQVPYVIEFTGTPRTGKTSLINNLKDFFKKKGFKVQVLEEFTTSEKYKNEIYPSLKDKYKNIVNTEIPKHVLKQLDEAINDNPDIIIVDRSLFDRLVWVERLYTNGGMSEKEYMDYKDLYLPLIKEKIDIVISTYTDSLTALKRDYNANLSLEKRNFLNEKNIDEYNSALFNMKELAHEEDINFKLFNTTDKIQREISFEIVDCILKDMRQKFLTELQNLS